MSIEAVKNALSHLEMDDSPRIIAKKSRDFYWYSPYLKNQLDGVKADLIITPRNEDDVIEILKTCYAHNVPVTPRGAGTGNYGQAMPLSGGVVLDMQAMSDIIEIKPGAVITGPGAIIAEIDKATRAHSGQELRMFPSTYKMASIAGFVCGGSGGIGSIQWGGLRDAGNIIRLRIVTLEETPRILEFTGDDINRISHAYGVNGIVTEVEMPLTLSHDWVDVMVAFPDFMEAVRFSDSLGNQDGLLTKLIAPVAAPTPHLCFRRYNDFIDEGDSVVLIMAAPQAMASLQSFCAQWKDAKIAYRADEYPPEERLPEIFEYSWNHTTQRMMNVEPTITYLQILYPYPDHIELVEKTHKQFAGDIYDHLEFTRFDGKITCFGLPIVLYKSEDQLNAIIQAYEDAGCIVFNPHRYTLEEGGMKQTDETQLAFKQEADPRGLLNPGKMIAWDDPNYDFTAHQTYLFPGLKA